MKWGWRNSRFKEQYSENKKRRVLKGERKENYKVLNNSTFGHAMPPGVIDYITNRWSWQWEEGHKTGGREILLYLIKPRENDERGERWHISLFYKFPYYWTSTSAIRCCCEKMPCCFVTEWKTGLLIFQTLFQVELTTERHNYEQLFFVYL